MKRIVMLALAVMLSLGAAGAVFAECPGQKTHKTADTTTTQDVKQGS